MIVAALRAVVLLLAVYVSFVAAVGVAARIAGAHVIARAVDAVTPRLVRRVLASMLGASLSLTATAAAETTPDPDAPVVMHRMDDAPSPPATTTTTVVVAGDVPTLEPSAAVEPTWTIQPGEHFWALAEATLSRAWGRAPRDSEVVPYWRRLIEHNRDRLIDANNPDLVYPGQRFEIPTPPTA